MIFHIPLVRKTMSPDRVTSGIELASEVENVPIMKLSEESGVSYVTLAKWRDEARGGEAAPGKGERPDHRSTEEKQRVWLNPEKDGRTRETLTPEKRQVG